MDNAKIRELPQKSRPVSTDMIIVEDNDGTKTVEISELRSLLQSTFYFNTVDDMKNASFKEGDTVTTLGYHSINDGGGAQYKIVYAPTDLDDGILVHYLHTSDTLRAHLVHNGELNVLKAGAFGNGESDDYTVFNKLIKMGYPLVIPRRKYKISGSLNIPSDTVMDFNNSEIICASSACVCIGLNEKASNIVVKNATFVGPYGVEVYAYGNNVTIQNCVFKSSGRISMSKGIIISGATNVTAESNMIGDEDYQVDYGIFMSSSKKGSTTCGNENISIHGNRMIVSRYGIDLTSVETDKNIQIVDNNIKGKDNIDLNNICGIQVSSNTNALLISSCGLTRVGTGVSIAGLVSATVSITDIIGTDVTILYAILSDQARVYISGLQKIITLDRNCYIFDRMTGYLTLNSEFDITVGSGYKCMQAKTSIAGDLIDNSDPRSKTKIELKNAMNDNLDNAVPGYKNVAISIDYSGNITDLPFPSLYGQVIAIYSKSGAVLKHNTNILLGDDITLDQYVPVVVKNIAGLWTRIG